MNTEQFRCKKEGCKANTWSPYAEGWKCAYCRTPAHFSMQVENKPTPPDRCPHGTDYGMDCQECRDGEPAPVAVPTPASPELSREVVKLVEAYGEVIHALHALDYPSRADLDYARDNVDKAKATLMAEFTRLQALSAYRPQVPTVLDAHAQKEYGKILDYSIRHGLYKGTGGDASAADDVLTYVEKLKSQASPQVQAPARFRVTIGDHSAEIQVDQKAPPEYHQGMVQTAIAEVLRRATPPKDTPPQSWPIVANVKTPEEALAAIHNLLMNLQPKIPQACYPKHAIFIDNYVNPCLAICEKFKEGNP